MGVRKDPRRAKVIFLPTRQRGTWWLLKVSKCLVYLDLQGLCVHSAFVSVKRKPRDEYLNVGVG